MSLKLTFTTEGGKTETVRGLVAWATILWPLAVAYLGGILVGAFLLR